MPDNNVLLNITRTFDFKRKKNIVNYANRI